MVGRNCPTYWLPHHFVTAILASDDLCNQQADANKHQQTAKHPVE